MSELVIESYEEGLKLECEYLNHSFTLSRDSEEESWYMYVTDNEADAFNVACDGYVSSPDPLLDSNELSIAQVLVEACKGACIEPPAMNAINEVLHEYV